MERDTYYCDTCDYWRETVEYAPGTARRCLTCGDPIVCGACGDVWTFFHANVCEGSDADTRGYVVEVRTTRVEVRYVRGRGNAEDAAYNAQAGGWTRDSEVLATVTRCQHMSGYVESVPLVRGGLVNLAQYTCEDCGERYAQYVEHPAVYAETVPRWNVDSPIRYLYTDTFTDTGDTDAYGIERLAHV